MAAINREFLVDFPQLSGFVQYFLPESQGSLLFVDLFAVGGKPSAATGDQTAIDPPAVGGGLPITELPLVGSARAHTRPSMTRTRNLPVDKIQPAGCRIRFHRAVPVVIGKVHQVGHQLGIFFGRKSGDRFFDFDNRAHNSKLAEKVLRAMRGVWAGDGWLVARGGRLRDSRVCETGCQATN